LPTVYRKYPRKDDPNHSTAIPPTTAAPSIRQAAVCKATAPPVDVEAESESEVEDPPLCAPPLAVDSLALRCAASPVNGAAATLVLFLQDEGFEYSVLEEN